MKCKIFSSRNREALQKAVNAWLETHVIECPYTQFSTVVIDSDVEYILEHTLVLFYIPPIGEDTK